MTITPAVRQETVRMLQQELRWRQQAQALAFDEPDAEIAQRHLLEFMRWGQPHYDVGWFQRELCTALERFSRDVTLCRSPRLLISAPPRHGKSEIVSRRFPIWHLGHNPTHEVVLATYGQEFSDELSDDARAVRDAVVEWWPHLAPKRGFKDGKQSWKIVGGGSVKATSAEGPLTGRGAHVLILDDPIKDAKEADSPVVRDARWKWFQSTVFTRLAPGAGVIIMATRWHEDDPSGRALKQLENGDVGWQRLDYPALAEHDEAYRKAGEPLHPERWSLEELLLRKKGVGPRVWSALYQGRPTSAAGGLFQREWLGHRFRHDPQRPERPYTERVISLDATFKSGDKADYVSMGAWGRYDWTEYHRLDGIRARMSYVETRQALRDFVRKWQPHAVLIEEKANGAALLSDLKGEIPGLIPFVPDKHGDKMTRAQLASRRFEAGQVKLPEKAEWAGDYVEELAAFPQGAHDDQVDETSQLFLWWHQKMSTGGGTKALNNAVSGLFNSRR